MQTTIKDQYDAALPGNLVVLPSFRGSAEVESCRAGDAIAPGDAVKLGDGTDSSVLPMAAADDAKLAYGVAVRSHSNFPLTPNITTGDGAYPVSKNSNIGIAVGGPIWVAVKAGQTPKKGDLAAPAARNATTGYMEWVVLASGQSKFRFDSTVKQGGVAQIRVESGALLGE